MSIEQIIALASVVLACFGAIGGTVRWAYREFKEQGGKLDRLEKESLALTRLYGEVRVRLHRVKLAFDMVAAELRHRDPHNLALASAEMILREAFPVEPKIPPNMEDILQNIGGDDE